MGKKSPNWKNQKKSKNRPELRSRKIWIAPQGQHQKELIIESLEEYQAKMWWKALQKVDLSSRQSQQNKRWPESKRRKNAKTQIKKRTNSLRGDRAKQSIHEKLHDQAQGK